MSGDYLADLLALATGRAAVVEPRQRQRFEPDGGVADPFTAAITEEIVAPPPPTGQRAERRPSNPSPASARSIVENDVPAASPVVATTPPRPDVAAAPPASMEAAGSPLGITPPEPKPSAQKTANPAAPVVQPATANPAPPQDPAPAGARQHPQPSVAPQPMVIAKVAAPTEARSPQPQPTMPARRMVPPPANAEHAIGAPAITIRIDRIDIHAPAPPAPPRPAPARTATAPTDLATYLAQRREGGW